MVLFGFNTTEEIAKTVADDEEEQAIDMGENLEIKFGVVEMEGEVKVGKYEDEPRRNCQSAVGTFPRPFPLFADLHQGL